MTTVIHATDIHLNFVNTQEVLTFCAALNESHPRYILLSGDIAEAPSVCHYLRVLATNVNAPIYFVLGNHDYYNGSVDAVRQDVNALCRELTDKLIYLTSTPFAKQVDDTLIVGVDGWADG